jgi:RNA polymerase sigma-70 factor (ECF subfamily)
VIDEPAAQAPAVVDVAQLYATHFRYVWRCLRSLGVWDRELDDALQDVFMVVQRKLPEFDAKVPHKTWLYAIALRIARRVKERQRRDQNRSATDDDPATPSLMYLDTQARVERNERLQLARRGLRVLDDDKREVFVLSQVEQMSAPEIAEVIGIPLNTVYSRLRAARSAFEAEVRRLSSCSRSAQ